MDKQAKGILKGATVGLIAGAIGGILLAPKSGKETREDIKKYLMEIRDKISDELGKAGEVTKDKYHAIVSKIVKGYEQAKKLTKKQANEISSELEENYEEVARATKSAKDK